MSTIKSSDEHLTLNADGASKEVKIQRNGTQVLATTSTGIDVTGTVTAVGSMNIDYSGSDTFATLVGPLNRDLRIDLQANGDTDSLVVRDLRDNSERFVVNAGGNVGIGTSTPLAPVVASTTVTADSDKIVYGMTQSDNNAGRIVGMGIASTGSVANQGLSFYTCLSSVQSERMRIDSSGNVAIGHTSTTGSKLAICDGANSQIQFFPEISTDTNLTQHYDPTASAYINAETRAASHSFKIGTANAMSIHSTGGVSVGTGTSIGSGNILVNEGIYISSSNGDYQIRGNSTGGGSATLYIGNKSIDTTASDARFKDVIGDCTNGLEIVKSLKVKDYTWKEGFDNDTTTVMSGLLAQEVELIDPSLVTKPTPKEAVEAVEEVRDADGNITTEAVKAVEAVNASDEGWSVKYQMIVPKLIQAIQELEARITALEA